MLQPAHRLRSAGRGVAGQAETSPPQRPAEEPSPGAGPAPPGGYRQQLQPEGQSHMRQRTIEYNIIFPLTCIERRGGDLPPVWLQKHDGHDTKLNYRIIWIHRTKTDF